MPDKPSPPSRGSLHRMVRLFVGVLLGEQNAINLYGEDHTSQDFEDDAHRRGLTVIPCDLEAGDYPLPHGVIDPLTDPKQKHPEKKQEAISLRNEVDLDGDARDRASAAYHGEGMPPVLYLQPGERITHMMVLPPNAELCHGVAERKA